MGLVKIPMDCMLSDAEGGPWKDEGLLAHSLNAWRMPIRQDCKKKVTPLKKHELYATGN
jgi:hypothetical protein